VIGLSGVTVMPPRLITCDTVAVPETPLAIARSTSRSDSTPTRPPVSSTISMWRKPYSLNAATASAIGRSGVSERTDTLMISATVLRPGATVSRTG